MYVILHGLCGCVPSSRPEAFARIQNYRSERSSQTPFPRLGHVACARLSLRPVLCRVKTSLRGGSGQPATHTKAVQ